MFPLILSLFFNLAFANLFSGTSFKSIPVAVVDNAEYRNETAFQSALNAEDDRVSGSDKLFHVSLMSQEDAAKSLKDGKVEGYIFFDNGVHVAVKDSDTDQTIIKEFVDSYLQMSSSCKTIISKNPAAAKYFSKLATADYIKAKTTPSTNTDGNAAYYYGLIAMAVMFGSFWGKREVQDIQADLSPIGARINLSPVNKLKAFITSCSASVTVEFFCLVILIIFLKYALGVGFGNQTVYIVALCFIGSIAGISFGAFITAVVKGSENLKHAVMLGLNLLLSCLAGMVSTTIKFTIAHKAPILAYINPASLISDAMYSLNFYSSHTRFFINLSALVTLSVVFTMIVYFVLRRQKYASL